MEKQPTMEKEEMEIFEKRLAEEISKKIAVSMELNGSGATVQVVLRKGEALPMREPETVNLTGTIDAPARWVESKQRLNHKEAYNGGNTDESSIVEENGNNSRVMVYREEGSVTLIENETSYYRNTIEGRLCTSEKYDKFGINSGDYKNPQDMADFFKMNRTCFASVAEANSLVNLLRNFEANVTSQMKDLDDRRGNITQLRQQVVQSNLPDSFTLTMPIFNGLPKQNIEVEVWIDPATYGCTLISAQAEDLKVELADKAIDEVVERIREAAPAITIIEV